MRDYVTGIIRDCCLVTFLEEPGLPSDCTILCGIVVEDFNHRFPSGSWFCSSKVTKVEEPFVDTLNSRYQVEGELKRLDLPWSAIAHIKQGVHPEAIAALTKEGFTIEEVCRD